MTKFLFLNVLRTKRKFLKMFLLFFKLINNKVVVYGENLESQLRKLHWSRAVGRWAIMMIMIMIMLFHWV